MDNQSIRAQNGLRILDTHTHATTLADAGDVSLARSSGVLHRRDRVQDPVVGDVRGHSMGSVEETRLLELTLSTEQLLDNYVPENVREAVYALYAAHITGGLRALMLNTPTYTKPFDPSSKTLSWMHSKTLLPVRSSTATTNSPSACIVSSQAAALRRTGASIRCHHGQGQTSSTASCDDVPVTTQSVTCRVWVRW